MRPVCAAAKRLYLSKYWSICRPVRSTEELHDGQIRRRVSIPLALSLAGLLAASVATVCWLQRQHIRQEVNTSFAKAEQRFRKEVEHVPGVKGVYLNVTYSEPVQEEREEKDSLDEWLESYEVTTERERRLAERKKKSRDAGEEDDELTKWLAAYGKDKEDRQRDEGRKRRKRDEGEKSEDSAGKDAAERGAEKDAKGKKEAGKNEKKDSLIEWLSSYGKDEETQK